MDTERVLEDQTVIVVDGRISLLGPADEIQIPVDSEVVDGAGAYLLPGLANMHAHLADFDPDPGHMLLYLAGGITTIRSLNTPWSVQKWRDKIASGVLPGPTIILSGPAIADFPSEYQRLALGLRAGVVLAIIFVNALLFSLVYGAIRFLASPESAANFASNWGLIWLVWPFWLPP
jgi:hypothetical protein